jgi:ABC-type transporter Mla subunit MlaD
MALTSTEIKRLLKPMEDFAPAIMRCAEIVEAAEQAEQTIRNREPAITALQKEIEALKEQQKHEQEMLDSLRADVVRVTEETAREKDEIKNTIKASKEKLKAAQDALDSTQKEHAALIASNQQELDGLNIVLEQKRKELADFRRAIPKTY